MRKIYARQFRGEKPLVSVVVPFLNESVCLPKLFERLEDCFNNLKVQYEIVLVDDGSTDESLSVIEAYIRAKERIRIKVLVLTRNFGKEAALTAGLEASTGDVIVPMDADLQDPPELIGEMLRKWEEGYDVVYGVRKGRSGESKTKRATAFGFYRLMGKLSSTEIPADTGDFRLMDRSVVSALIRLPERSRFMKGLFAWVGFRQTSVSYEREVRFKGRSNWNYWRLLNFAIDGITSFSRVPLQVLSVIGLSMASIALVYGTWRIMSTIIFGISVPGYASLMTAILFLGGIQLIGLGLLGEYLGRIFEEVKARPLYLIRETWEQ
jgi:glycosyltransferase involved in cell wall biosynthesis